jgi:multimeric flavodoxin WrbA
MENYKLSDDAKVFLEKLLQFWPGMVRPSWRKKIERSVHFHSLLANQKEVSLELVIEAVKEIVPPSFEPLLLRLTDPQALKDIVSLQEKVDESNPGIAIRCWDKPSQLPKYSSTKDPSSMKIVAISASSRKGGNTTRIVEEVLAGAEKAGAKTELFPLDSLNISPCTGCLSCHKKDLSTFCVIKDDMNQLYQKILDSDGLIYGFPIFTSRESALSAAFLDRMSALRSPLHISKLKEMKPGVLVSTWGWPSSDSYDHVVEFVAMVLSMFKIDTVEVVTGSGFWGAYHKGKIDQLAKDGLREAFAAGQRLVSGG